MSTEQQRNVDILKRAYAEWAANKARDFSCWMTIASDEITLDSLARGAHPLIFTQSRSGKDELLGYLQGLTADWDMVSYDMDEYVAEGDRVVAIGQTAWRNKKTGKVAETPKLDVWRMRDGQAIEYEEFYDTARVVAAATP